VRRLSCAFLAVWLLAGAAPLKRPVPRRPAPAAPARKQQRETKQKGPRAFLDVKTWYLDYEVTVHSKGSGKDMHSSTTAKFALDFSDLGPSR
jgi:hypothetical protein